MIVKTNKIIFAGEGKILTNGEIYCKWARLADGVNEADFYEITEEEYNAIMEAKEAAIPDRG